MRVLLITDNFPPESNAPALRCWDHGRVWASEGAEVEIVTCAPNFPEGRVYPGYLNEWFSREQMEGMSVVRLKTFMAPNRGFFLRTLDHFSFLLSVVVNTWRLKRPDVVIATSPQFFAGLAGLLFSWLRRVPLVIEVRDLWPKALIETGVMRPGLLYQVLVGLERLLYRRAAHVIVVAESFVDHVTSFGVPDNRISVVTNGADMSRLMPGGRAEELAQILGLTGKTVVGYIGTLGIAHGLESVIAAADLLRDRADIAFLFVGWGASREDLMKQAEVKELKNVVWVDRQPPERIKDYWSICDIALIPRAKSNFFGTMLPAKMFEAVAMEVPILMSVPRGEATRMVETLGLGLTVEPENAAEISEGIKRMADNPGFLAECRRNAQREKFRFDRSALARKVLGILALVTKSGEGWKSEVARTDKTP